MTLWTGLKKQHSAFDDTKSAQTKKTNYDYNHIHLCLWHHSKVYLQAGNSNILLSIKPSNNTKGGNFKCYNAQHNWLCETAPQFILLPILTIIAKYKLSKKI